MVPDHWSNDAMVSMDRCGLGGRVRYLGRDIMIWIIETLTIGAYLIRVYIIKSTIIAIINVS